MKTYEDQAYQTKIVERYFDKRGREIKGLSKYQRTHAPLSVEEIKCTGLVIDGECQQCGRLLARNIKHKPNITGKLGYVEIYRDGSKIIRGGQS